MQRFLFISAIVLVCFYIEYVCSVFFGKWFSPNLLIILVVFFNLFRGIRYSFYVAIMAGLLKDSYGVKVFGLNVFAMVFCAYITSHIKLRFYHAGVSSSRVLIVFIITSIFLLVQYVLNLMIVIIPFSHALTCVLIPELFATLIITPYALRKYKQCALRLFA